MVIYTCIPSIHKVETNLDYIVLVSFKKKQEWNQNQISQASMIVYTFKAST